MQRPRLGRNGPRQHDAWREPPSWPCFGARCETGPPLREKARGLGKSSKWVGSSAPTVRKTGRRLWWEGQREGPGGLGGAATSTARLLLSTLVIEMLKNPENQGRLDSVLAKDSRNRTTARWIVYDWRAQLSRSAEVRAVRGSRGSNHGSNSAGGSMTREVL